MKEQTDLQVFYLNNLAEEDSAFLRQKGIAIEKRMKFANVRCWGCLLQTS